MNRSLAAFAALAASCGSNPPPRPQPPRPDSRPAPAISKAPSIAATSPASRSAAHDDPVVARAAGRDIRASEAFDSILFHFRDSGLEVLRKLTGDALIAAEAQKLGVAVDPADIDDGVKNSLRILRERIATEFGPGTDLDRFLTEELRTTPAEYTESLRKFTESGRLAAILIRFDQIRTERIVVRQIAVRDRATADELRAKVIDGANFEALARAHSIAPSKTDGGKLPPFDREFDHPLVAPAFATPVGSIGEPVEDARGGKSIFHLFRVVERFPARTAPYSQVKEEIARSLRERPIERFEFEAYLRKLAQHYPVEILGQEGGAVASRPELPESAPSSAPATGKSP